MRLPDESTVTLERDGDVLLMGLNRREKRNAFNRAMLSDLSLAYAELDRDPELLCGVLFAHGDHFTSGLDLVDVAPMMADGGWSWAEGASISSGWAAVGFPSRSLWPSKDAG